MDLHISSFRLLAASLLKFDRSPLRWDKVIARAPLSFYAFTNPFSAPAAVLFRAILASAPQCPSFWSHFSIHPVAIVESRQVSEISEESATVLAVYNSFSLRPLLPQIPFLRGVQWEKASQCITCGDVGTYRRCRTCIHLLRSDRNRGEKILKTVWEAAIFPELVLTLKIIIKYQDIWNGFLMKKINIR